MMYGAAKTCHAVIVWMIALNNIAGAIVGITTCKKRRNRPRPSSDADSIKGLGASRSATREITTDWPTLHRLIMMSADMAQPCVVS